MIWWLVEFEFLQVSTNVYDIPYSQEESSEQPQVARLLMFGENHLIYRKRLNLTGKKFNSSEVPVADYHSLVK